MNDHIHAAIAAERVRDLVDTGETRRATRRVKRERAAAEATARSRPQAQLNGHGSRVAALLRLRPWVM